jgi:hypothetical protein
MPLLCWALLFNANQGVFLRSVRKFHIIPCRAVVAVAVDAFLKLFNCIVVFLRLMAGDAHIAPQSIITPHKIEFKFNKYYILNFQYFTYS